MFCFSDKEHARASGGKRTWGDRPVSEGAQSAKERLYFSLREWKAIGVGVFEQKYM